MCTGGAISNGANSPQVRGESSAVALGWCLVRGGGEEERRKATEEATCIKSGFF